MEGVDDRVAAVRDIFWAASASPWCRVEFEEGSEADGRRYLRCTTHPGLSKTSDVDSKISDVDGASANSSWEIHFPAGERVGLVSLLRDRVILSRVAMRASDDFGNEHEWRSGEPNLSSERVSSMCVAGPAGGTVWWMDGEGAVLVDGWATDERFFGSIVDMSRYAGLDRSAIRALLSENIETAVTHAAGVVGSPFWLQRFVAFGDAGAADEIACRLSTNADFTFTLLDPGVDGQPIRVDASTVGILTGDEDVLNPGGGVPEIQEWRLSAMIAAGDVVVPGLDGPSEVATWSPVVAARPSDALLLGLLACHTTPGGDLVAVGPWRDDPFDFLILRHVTGFGAGRLAGRLRELGFPVSDEYDTLPEPTPLARAAIREVSNLPPHAIRQLSRQAVKRLASEYSTRDADAEAQLAAQLLPVAADPASDGDDGWAEEVIAPPDDAPAISSYEYGDPQRILFADPTALEASSLLDPSVPVHPAHVRLTAEAFDMSVKAVARVLIANGYTIDDDASLSRAKALKRVDLHLASAGSWDGLPVRPTGAFITTAELALAAAETGRSAAKLAARCRRLGYRVGRVPSPPPGTWKMYVTLLSDDFSGEPPLVPAKEEIRAIRIAAFATRFGVPVSDVARLYTELGFRVRDPRAELPRRRPAPLDTR